MKKFYKVNYKDKWFVIQDKLFEDDIKIGTITKEEAIDEDISAWHKDACKYYGISPYIGNDKDLKKIYEILL